MEVFRTLSTPLEGNYRWLAAELATLHYAAFCQRVADRDGGGHHREPLSQLLEKVSSRPPSLGCWTPEASIIFAGIKPPGASPGHIASDDWLRAQALLSGVALGLLDDVELALDVDQPLLLCGRALSGRLSLQADGQRIVVCEADGTRTHWCRIAERDGTPVWNDEQAPDSFVMRDGRPAIRLVGEGWHASPWIQDTFRVQAPSADMAPQIEAALDLLQDIAPDHAAWVCCLLKEITPLRRPAANTIASNSSALRMGGIDLAVPANALETAEMLVHECTHQYYHMASWLGPTVVPGAGSYYSPLKHCNRPLDRILLGYHAFGNAMMVFDRMAASGLQDQIRIRWETVAGYLRELSVPLQDGAELSELGQALFHPLRARLAALEFREPVGMNAPADTGVAVLERA